jgi:hypothetical protein
MGPGIRCVSSWAASEAELGGIRCSRTRSELGFYAVAVPGRGMRLRRVLLLLGPTGFPRCFEPGIEATPQILLVDRSPCDRRACRIDVLACRQHRGSDRLAVILK